MILRPATLADAPLLLVWRNDPVVINMSSSQETVTLDSHCEWLAQQINADRQFVQCTGVYIAIADDLPVGTGRIVTTEQDFKDGRCTLSYSIQAHDRGKGYGRVLVRLLVEKARSMGFKTYRTRIKRSNAASLTCAIASGVNCIELF